MTLVSFVMAVWNPNPRWLFEAVNGVLAQQRCDIDLIVVDDGCPDPVERLLEPVACDQLRVVRIAHGGESAARNAGLAAARGDRIRFADADDVFEPGSTARLLDLMGDREDVVTYGATRFCDSELRPIWTMTSRVEGSALVPCLLGAFAIRPCSLLFPRRVVETAGDWDSTFRVCQDWDFVLRTLEVATVRGTREVVTNYRKHSSSATGNIENGERGARLIIERYFDRHPEQRGTILERRAQARVEAMLARAALTHGDPRRAIRAAGRAAVLDPRALVEEAAQSFPALAGRLRAAV